MRHCVSQLCCITNHLDVSAPYAYKHVCLYILLTCMKLPRAAHSFSLWGPGWKGYVLLRMMSDAQEGEPYCASSLPASVGQNKPYGQAWNQGGEKCTLARGRGSNHTGTIGTNNSIYHKFEKCWQLEEAFGYEIMWCYFVAFGFCSFLCPKKHQFSFSYDRDLNLTHHRGHVTVRWGQDRGREWSWDRRSRC